MGLFDSPAVKLLKRRATDVGVLQTKVLLGEPYMSELLASEENTRGPLREAYEAAAQEVGAEKATKIAVRRALVGLDAYHHAVRTQYPPGGVPMKQNEMFELIQAGTRQILEEVPPRSGD